MPRILGVLVTATLLLAGLFAAPASALTEICRGSTAAEVARCDTSGYASVMHQSHWRMVAGHNCTNYVAYRLGRDGVSDPGGLGAADNWAKRARQLGLRVDTKPAPGAVAFFSGRHHVAYVEEVGNGYIVLAEDHYPGYFPSPGMFRKLRVSPGDSWYPTEFIHFREPGPYLDVPRTHQFHDEIAWLKQSGITTGYADGTFRPGQPVARKAMAAFLYRAKGRPAFTPPAVSPFPDVPTNHQFYKEIAWLRQSGITTGYADGTFRPDGYVERQAMAAFLYRAAGATAGPPATARFPDVPTNHQFFVQISWLVNQRITTGYADGTFRPAQPVARHAMAAFLYRLYG